VASLTSAKWSVAPVSAISLEGGVDNTFNNCSLF
jgi:hypothetical protein